MVVPQNMEKKMLPNKWDAYSKSVLWTDHLLSSFTFNKSMYPTKAEKNSHEREASS